MEGVQGLGLCCKSCIHSRPKSFARIDLPWCKIWGSVSGGDTVTRARCPRSSVEADQKHPEIKGENKTTSLHLRKIGACLHQILHLRNEYLLSTPVRQCIWSAKRTWIWLKWIPWRNRVVPRQSQQPMEKCRRMKRPQCTSKNWI